MARFIYCHEQGSIFLSLSLLLSMNCPLTAKIAKLKLFYDDTDISHSTDSKRCPAGVFMKEPTRYSCACVTGVWGFYQAFCSEPIKIIGGNSHCAPLPHTKLSQVMIFGNPKSVFESSISHFTGQFKKMTSFFTDDDDNLDIDGSSTFLTISDVSWTIYGDTGSSICLKAIERGSRKFCTFGHQLISSLSVTWKLIVKIRKGCLSTLIYYADKCSSIMPQNDETGCISPNMSTTTEGVWIRLPGNKNRTTSPETTTDGWWIPIPGGNRSHHTTTEDTTTTGPWWIPLPGRNSTDNGDWWIPIPGRAKTTMSTTPATTTEPPDDPCSNGITRERVKQYWHTSSVTSCNHTVTQVVFTDQLRRFATTQMNKVLPSRLKSLEQLERLLHFALQIMQATCPNEIVSSQFFNVTMMAFLQFVNEDFFYGMNEADPDSFERIELSLQKCLTTAKPFAFETTELDCQFNQINGALLLPGQRKVLVIPDEQASHNFEPLIESAWKMFLNAHSYCFKHFHTSNDHHHFAVFIMEAFTTSIFQKWVEPIDDMPLYRLVLPSFKYLKEIMTNIDYCVAATNVVSGCPTWLTRRKRNSKIANKKRRKRSIWIIHITESRRKASIWNDTAYCLKHMDDPEFKLDFGRCSHPLG